MGWPTEIADGVIVRHATPADGAAVAAAYVRNREHLAPWDPIRPESFFTAEAQEVRLAERADSDARGLSATGLIVEPDGTVIGVVNLSNVVRGAYSSADLGYWVDGERTGRGLATAAIGAALEQARSMGLHRVQAATLLHNVGSQTALRRQDFVPFGLAPAYIHIAGAWRDHVLFQRLLHDGPPS